MKTKQIWIRSRNIYTHEVYLCLTLLNDWETDVVKTASEHEKHTKNNNKKWNQQI